MATHALISRLIGLFALAGTWAVTFGFWSLMAWLIGRAVAVYTPLLSAAQWPSLWLVAAASAWAYGVLFFVLWVWQYGPGRVRDGAGQPCERLPEGHPASRLLNEVAFGFEAPRPGLYLSRLASANAFAMRSGRRGVVVVHAGLIQSADHDGLRWILAHEMAHLHHGDINSARFHNAVVQTMVAVDRVRLTLHDPVERLLRPLSWFRAIAVPLLIPLRVSASWIRRIHRGHRWAVGHMDRRNEYAADAAASAYCSGRVGRRTLARIAGASRRRRGSSHPAAGRRIDRMDQ